MRQKDTNNFGRSNWKNILITHPFILVNSKSCFLLKSIRLKIDISFLFFLKGDNGLDQNSTLSSAISSYTDAFCKRWEFMF